jgi:hypothetical protein
MMKYIKKSKPKKRWQRIVVNVYKHDGNVYITEKTWSKTLRVIRVLERRVNNEVNQRPVRRANCGKTARVAR